MERVDDIWADAAVASGMAALDLRRLGDTSFEGDSLPMPRGRVFGGQVLAQSLLAAGATVAEDRFAHSLHGYFLRAGDATQPIQFEVEILRDGGSFSARRTHALQNGKPILSLIASFQLEQEGPEHAAPMPEVPGPEEAASGVDIMAPFAGHPSADFWLTKAPFDVRHLDGSLFLGPDAEPKSTQMAWMRVRRPIDASDLMHRALLAFGSDQVMLEPLLRRHGASWVTPGVAVASLDHAMWWYRPARADEWLLFVQEAPNARGGRGLTAARIYAQDGTLVASAAQEGMIRM